ncbi:MAG: UvrD-helicase domain-containing protein [Phycisphaerales bacterium]|nr:MAG: UvrD-helicase domain-containing protein [Phycisphaerales bacterium]
MGKCKFTDEQKQAIEAIDRSVLVTAAAGSGKTAVLTGRCAYLVCDAPPAQRCGVDQLLVVTFTEAAASEMRSRIHDAIRERLADRPHDLKLRAQLGLLDTAAISTLHAFCLWVVRRWFNLAGLDASAVVLDADEARLMRAEAIEALFTDLYDDQERAQESVSDRNNPAPGLKSPRRDSLGARFRRLVDVYGLGRDGELASLVLGLAAFVDSLPDPEAEAWLDDAVRHVGDSAGRTIEDVPPRLLEELTAQQTECQALARFVIEQFGPGAFYGRVIERYARQLGDWQAALAGGASFDDVQHEIDEYHKNGFDLKGSPRMGSDAPSEHRALRDRARDCCYEVRDTLFKKRLRDRFGRFSSAELLEGLRSIAPHVETVVALVRGFGERYAQAKRAAGVLDFADLERFAYRLLSRPQREVASVLRRRFAHVLVDEFQDINPLQEAILRLVSREQDPDRADNLFAVGDVKQSIYGFRLAEPRVLRQRENEFDKPESRGLCIRLQRNYRSRRTILDGVNLLFRPLMRREIGDIEYNSQAELRVGRKPADRKRGEPIELHLLERRPSAENEPDESAQRYVDLSDPAQWTAVEREAFLIGTMIRDLVSPAGEARGGAAFCHADIAILLRTAAHTAGPMVEMLSRMGISAYADARGALFGALEIQDVLSLLQVLDNQQQDIPLAALLRAGVLGERFDEDDLVSIRSVNRAVPFHETVRLYPHDGDDPELRSRMEAFLRRLARYRSDIRQRPLADVLWRVYQETGYLAYVGGLGGGAQRRANLLRLHQRARQFGTFQRQGLHRFLRFIDSLKDEKQDFGVAPAVGESDNVVRVMTVHHSKGLQFPVVFVAGLGKQFNLQDARGRLIYDRGTGIGLRVVDRERMIEYPSAIHQLVAQNIETTTRAEELRLLYVAMTRAEEKLVLVGSTDLAAVQRVRQYRQGGAQITPLRVASAGTALDWVVPVLAAGPTGKVAWADDRDAGRIDGLLYRVMMHGDPEIGNWHLEDSGTGSETAVLTAAASLEPLPAAEPTGECAERADAIVARLDHAYPHLADSSVRAVMAASELKRPFDALADPDEQPRERVRELPAFDVPSLDAVDRRAVSGAQRGTATHLLLQHLRFDKADDVSDVRTQARRLVDEGLLTAEEADAIDIDAIVWFLSTPLGRRVRRAGAAFRREEMFLSAEPAEMFDRTVGGGSDVPVVVRGIVDGVLTDGDSLELLDYKTDRITAEQVPERAESYAMQMRLYARAIARCRRRPVRHGWLVFLHPRVVIEAVEKRR